MVNDSCIGVLVGATAGEGRSDDGVAERVIECRFVNSGVLRQRALNAHAVVDRFFQIHKENGMSDAEMGVRFLCVD